MTLFFAVDFTAEPSKFLPPHIMAALGNIFALSIKLWLSKQDKILLHLNH